MDMNTVLAVLGVIVVAVIVIALSIWLGKSRKRDLDRAMGKVAPDNKKTRDAKAAADKKAKAAQTAAEKEKAARDKAQTAARSDARRQIALILRNGGTVPGDLWQQSGYSAVTIAAMLRGRKG